MGNLPSNLSDRQAVNSELSAHGWPMPEAVMRAEELEAYNLATLRYYGSVPDDSTTSECDHGKRLYEVCVYCDWDDYDSARYVALTDSAGTVCRVDLGAQNDYELYLLTGVAPELYDYEEYHDSDFYENAPVCAHGGFGVGACLRCDVFAYDELLSGPVAPPLLGDTYVSLQRDHARSKQRAATRRDKTIARHKRYESQARLKIVLVTEPDNQDESVRSESLELVNDKPWQARFRRFHRFTDLDSRLVADEIIHVERAKREGRKTFVFSD